MAVAVLDPYTHDGIRRIDTTDKRKTATAGRTVVRYLQEPRRNCRRQFQEIPFTCAVQVTGQKRMPLAVPDVQHNARGIAAQSGILLRPQHLEIRTKRKRVPTYQRINRDRKPPCEPKDAVPNIPSRGVGTDIQVAHMHSGRTPIPSGTGRTAQMSNIAYRPSSSRSTASPCPTSRKVRRNGASSRNSPPPTYVHPATAVKATSATKNRKIPPISVFLIPIKTDFCAKTSLRGTFLLNLTHAAS